MGVHTTFVRSVDLDEWTQRQIDAMRLGGNANARKFFRQHGLTDMHGKIEKKYTSKAAVSYRNELKKQVDAAAVARGEAVAMDANDVAKAGSLLENLALQDKADAAAALVDLQKSNKQPVTAQPKAVLASKNASAKGKLVVTPPNSGGLKAPMLRKPASKASSTMLLKKKSSGGATTKLRVNKLSVTKLGDDDFDDIGAIKDEPEPAPAPAPVAQPVVVAPPAPAPAPVPAPIPVSPQSSMETGMSKLKAMNSDFFSGF